MGLTEEIPNPLSAMLRDAFGELLLPGTPKYATPGDATMLAQQQMMAQMMSAGGGFAAPQAAASQAATEAPKEEAPVVEEKTHYDIKLEKYDDTAKIKIIKELRTIDKNLSIKAAKDAVEGAPSVIQSGVKKEDAEKIKAALEALGATIVLV
jgi:large subunit ribosomal protein L7/L12